jgi:endoglucanase
MKKILSNVEISTSVVFCLLGCCLTNGYARQSDAATLQRGRPTLNAAGTTFVGDNGQLLRGPFTSSEWGSPAPYDEIADMKNLGFNAVHLYGECFDKNYPNAGSTSPGYAVSRIDSVVQATRDLGMYLVITIGNGANNGNYNYDYVVDFWDFYSERYADETQVLFEIQNEPVAWGPPYSDSGANPPGAIDMEAAAYKAIRSHAPDTPVLLFSYAVFGGSGGASAALEDIDAFNRAVGGDPSEIWSKTAVGFHGYAGWTGTSEAVAALLDAGYPCFMTEFASDSWGVNGGGFDVHLASELERMQVSWTTFQYIPPWGVSDDVTVPECYKDRVDRAGMSWTPDYGTWPVARGAFSDDGLPWATTDTWINNHLVGILRLEAEDFDWGGQDVAYGDDDSDNWGGEYRPDEGVDITASSDTDGGYAVGWTVDGEWLEYSIYVPEPGFYDLSLRVASSNTGCAARIICYDLDKTGTWTIPNTGGAQTWTTITRQVFFEFGRQKLRFEILTGGFNLNWIELSPSTDAQVANGTYKLANQNSGMVMENNTANHHVVQKAYSGANIQKWNLLHLGAGQYRVQSVHDNWYWNTWYETMTWWWDIGSQGQRFIVRPVEDGYYRIMPVNSGKSYEVENASLAGGAAIVQNEYAGMASQKWAILAPSAPAFPTGLNAVWISANQIDLSWSASAGATSYNIKRSATLGGPYTTVATHLTATGYSDLDVTMESAYNYVVSANTANGESLHSAELHVSTPMTKLTGTIIGTSGSWGNDPSRRKEAAMDGDIGTFYDATSGTGHWVGLDFGSDVAHVITEIRYVPRSGFSNRMVGGKIQGSNTANFSSGVTDLFTITDRPTEGVYTVQAITNPTAFRYVRYLSAPNGYCNVAEIEFYREGLPTDNGSSPRRRR